LVVEFEIDPKTLIWVKEEVEATLEEAKSTLEIYLESDRSTARIAVVADGIHKIRGAVEMVEIFGAVLLAKEMEVVAIELMNDNIKRKEDAIEVIMRGMLQLPAYLAQLYHGSKDIPLVLLPLLNDMRAVQEKPLLTESAFFSPNLAAFKPVLADQEQSGGDTNTWDIRTIAKKLRPVYLVGLLDLFHDKKLKKSLRMLATVIMNLEQASTQKQTEQVWWVSAGVIHALYDNGLQSSVAIKLLLGKVDRLIKRMIDEGESVLTTDPPHDLMKNLLYYVGRSSSISPRVRELKLAFSLTDSLPDSDAIIQAQDELIGFNANIMENIANQLKEELLKVKDTLDITVHIQHGDASTLQPVIERLRTIADALGMLGLNKLRKLIHKQEAFVSNLIQIDSVLSSEDVLQIARILLYIESSLYDLNVREEANEIIEDKDLSELSVLPEAEYIEVVNTAVKEALEDVAKIKDAVIKLSKNPEDFELMTEVPGLLGLVIGAVKILSHPRVVKVLQAINEFVDTEIVKNKKLLDPDSFDLLANSIVGAEYYLEGILQKSVSSNFAIEVAEISLANLGYAPTKVEAVKIVDQTSEAGEALSISDESAESDIDSFIIPMLVPIGSDVEEAEAEINAEVDQELVTIFLNEAGDELEEISSCLEKWKQDQNDQETLAILVRSFHTLKGAGRIVGASSIGVLAWSIEELLRRILDERIEPSYEIVELLEETVPMLTQLVMQMKHGEEQENTLNFQPLIDTARELREAKNAYGF